jgi:transcriptional regulator with XRE-family HTH domain
VETVLSKLGENVRRLRDAAGISQEELASRADLDRTLISSVENGRKLARIDTLVKLSRGLAVPLDVLLEGIA